MAADWSYPNASRALKHSSFDRPVWASGWSARRSRARGRGSFPDHRNIKFAVFGDFNSITPRKLFSVDDHEQGSDALAKMRQDLLSGNSRASSSGDGTWNGHHGIWVKPCKPNRDGAAHSNLPRPFGVTFPKCLKAESWSPIALIDEIGLVPFQIVSGLKIFEKTRQNEESDWIPAFAFKIFGFRAMNRSSPCREFLNFFYCIHEARFTIEISSRRQQTKPFFETHLNFDKC
jgi:hypothetical protein